MDIAGFLLDTFGTSDSLLLAVLVFLAAATLAELVRIDRAAAAH